MKQLDIIRLRCQKWLKKEGYFYKNGWWCYSINEEQQHYALTSNKADGYIINISSELTVFQLASGIPEVLSKWGFSLEESFFILERAYEDYQANYRGSVPDSFWHWAQQREWELESNDVEPLWINHRAQMIRAGHLTPSPEHLSIPAFRDAWKAYQETEWSS